MNSFDYLVIYLSCGAPLGVLYFLQNRREQNSSRRLLFGTLFTFVCWVPFGFRLLPGRKAVEKFIADKKIFSNSAKVQNDFFSFQKQFEETLQMSVPSISIFEFREVFERYVGLTIAKDCKNIQTTEPEKEFFRIAADKNVDIGAVCLKRRNLRRLNVHQVQARQDFLQIISQLAKFAFDEKEFVKSVFDFFRILKDTEAQSALDLTLPDNLLNEKDFAVNYSENFLRS